MTTTSNYSFRDLVAEADPDYKKKQYVYQFSNGREFLENYKNLYDLPGVWLTSITSIADTTATANINVISLGSSNLTQYGVCWSTSENPTTADSKTTEGVLAAAGAKTSSMTGLTASTRYYVRPYATNGTGTVYGNQLEIETTA